MRSSVLKYFSALTILCLFFLTACNYHIQKRIPPKAIKGVLDLTDWDFKRDGPVDLSGEYAFYWKQYFDGLVKSQSWF